MCAGKVHTAALFALLLACALAAQADRLVLKPEAFVKGPSVTLGDVAQIESEFAETLATIDLGAAALPGDSKRVNASLITSRIRSAGIDPATVEITGSPDVRARTMHQDISKTELAESLRDYIALNMPWEPAETQIDVPEPLQGMIAPDGLIDIEWQTNPQYAYLGPGSFRGTVRVDGQAVRSLTMRAMVETYADVLIARGDIARGKIIGSMDVESKKFSMSAQTEQLYTSLEDVVGQTASRTIFAGQPLTPRNTAAPLLIKRGQLVNVEARIGALIISDRAKALADARAGDVVQLQNLNSNEVFQGFVQNDGNVEIP